MDDLQESWDSDPDLLIPPGPFSLALHLSGTGSHSGAESETEGSSGGTSSLNFFSSEGGGEWGDEDDAFASGGGIKSEWMDGVGEGEMRTREEINQSSIETDSSKEGTLKGLMTSFSGLSIATTPTEENPSPSVEFVLPPSSSSTSSSPKTATLRLSSSLSTLLSTVVSGPGTVTHLGSTPHGQAKSVLGDWDEDVDLNNLPSNFARPLRPKSSFASHISDDPDEDEYFANTTARALPTPRRSGGDGNAKGKGKTSSEKERGREEEEDAFDESDFDLPNELARVTLSPTLMRKSAGVETEKAVNAHERSDSDSTMTTVGGSAMQSLSVVPPERGLTASPLLVDTSGEEDEDDDAAFFQEIVLPPYFLGGPGAMTPPSDSESKSGSRIDLQAMLRRKLEARTRVDGGREGSSTERAGTGGIKNKLDGYRERKEELGGEHGLQIDEGIKLGAERMRSRSGPPLASMAKGKGKALASPPRNTPTQPRRPPLPSAPTNATANATATVNIRRISTSSAGSSISIPLSPSIGHGRPPSRPVSAAGSVARDRDRDRRVAVAPPPAPSAASRDRIRPRSASLRTVSSMSSLNSASSAVRSRVPLKIDTAATKTLPVLSPIPTPTPSSSASASTPIPLPLSNANSNPTPSVLRSKKSQSHLLATPTSGNRALARKRSLQNLPATPTPRMDTPTSLRQGLRSPPPTAPPTATSHPQHGSSPSTPRPPPRTSPSNNFAAPTTASTLRVRERVISGPSASPFNIRHQLHPPLPTSRPSSALGSHPRPPPPNHPTTTRMKATHPPPLSQLRSSSATSLLAGLTIPAAPLTFSRPKRARQYGDGTELDAFDDLPTSKERERERTVSSPVNVGKRGSWRSSSGGSNATVKGKSSTAGVKSPLKKDSNSLMGGMGDVETVKARSRRADSASTSKGSSIGSTASFRTVVAKGEVAPSVNPNVVGKRIRSESPAGLKGVGKAKEGGKKKKEQGPKREPQLIRNLGPLGVPKVHGEMTWNPSAQRWEGNESVLRDFDHILTTSTRPALITQLTSASPSRIGFPSLPFPRSNSSTSTSTNPPILRSNVKVVGSMVFDPSRLSWYSLIPEGEEELDLAMFDGEVADDESGAIPRGGGDGWEKGEQERMLKNRASFISVMSEDSEDLMGMGGSGTGEGEEGVMRGLWKESIEAENRHRAEMRPWTVALTTDEWEEEKRREWLFDLRKLILDTRSP